MSQPVEATIYDWKSYYSAPAFAIWLVFIVALALPKANRDLRVLLIFVPLAIINLIWLPLKMITGMPSASAAQFDTVLQSVALAMAVLWLIGVYFMSFSGLVRFLLSFGTVVVVAASGISSYSMELSNETALFLVFFVFLAATFLAGIALTRAACRGRYGPVRFMLWLALWTLIGSIIATFGFVIAGHLIMSTGQLKAQLSEVLVGMFIVGPILGLALYFLNLPFMILGFSNPFFRERLCGCLGLKREPAAAMPTDADNIGQ